MVFKNPKPHFRQTNKVTKNRYQMKRLTGINLL